MAPEVRVVQLSSECWREGLWSVRADMSFGCTTTTGCQVGPATCGNVKWYCTECSSRPDILIWHLTTPDKTLRGVLT